LSRCKNNFNFILQVEKQKEEKVRSYVGLLYEEGLISYRAINNEKKIYNWKGNIPYPSSFFDGPRRPRKKMKSIDNRDPDTRVELNKNNRRNRAGEQQRNNVDCCLVTNIYIYTYQINPKFIIYNRIQCIRFLLYK